MKTTDSNVQIIATATQFADGKNGFSVKVTGLDSKLDCERKFSDPLKAMRYMFLLHKKLDLQINRLDLTAVSVAYNKAKAALQEAQDKVDEITNAANVTARDIDVKDMMKQQLSLEFNEEEPLTKQYKELKAKHPEALLLFRTGDFYQMWFEDAREGSEILGITLTMNRRRPNALFPAHALDSYLPKLIRAGKRVAICDNIDANNNEIPE